MPSRAIHQLLFLLLLTAAPLLAQDNPRIRIRVFDENAIDGFTAGTEISSTVYLDEIGSERKGQLERIKQFLKNEQWTEAVDMLMRLSENDLHELAVLDEDTALGFARYKPLSRVVNQLVGPLARNSPETISSYRDRIDPLAKRWFDEAQAEHNEQLYRRLINNAFDSSHGDDALLALGDVALEQGRYAEARRNFRLVHASLSWSGNHRRLPYWVRANRGEVPSALATDLVTERLSGDAYPDSDIPLVDVWARMVLTSILEGNRKRAASELAILKHAWPNAAGKIAGTQDSYAKMLSQMLTSSHAWPRERESADWPTFAGSPSRNRNSDIEIDIPIEPTWRIPLTAIAASDHSAGRRYKLPDEPAGEMRDQPCSHFPIVVGDLVLIKDESKMRCLNLASGKPAWTSQKDGSFFESMNQGGAAIRPFGNQQNVRLGQLRFTLSAAQGVATSTIGSHQGAGGHVNSALLGFDLQRQGAIQFGPVNVDGPQWSFHGAPLNDGRRCWIGMRLRENTAQDYVACFDVTTGDELWRTRICSAETLGQNVIEATNNFLLTKHEDTIFVSTHLGTVAAVSAREGKTRWLTKYRRRGPKRENLTDQNWYSIRDLTPCLIHADLAIVAPSDTNKIFALHRDSGELIWQTTVPSDVTQILGVGDNDHLVLSGRRLWWMDLYTGRQSTKVSVNPFPSDAKSEPTGVGRGVLSAGNIYWPAVEDEESRIYVLRQKDGKPIRQPIDLSAGEVRAGNLILASDHLLIAGPSELVAFKLDE